MSDYNTLDKLSASEIEELIEKVRLRAEKKNQDLLEDVRCVYPEGDDRKYVRKLELGPEPKDEEDYSCRECGERSYNEDEGEFAPETKIFICSLCIPNWLEE